MEPQYPQAATGCFSWIFITCCAKFGYAFEMGAQIIIIIIVMKMDQIIPFFIQEKAFLACMV